MYIEREQERERGRERERERERGRERGPAAAGLGGRQRLRAILSLHRFHRPLLRTHQDVRERDIR